MKGRVFLFIMAFCFFCISAIQGQGKMGKFFKSTTTQAKIFHPKRISRMEPYSLRFVMEPKKVSLVNNMNKLGFKPVNIEVPKIFNEKDTIIVKLLHNVTLFSKSEETIILPYKDIENDFIFYFVADKADDKTFNVILSIYVKGETQPIIEKELSLKLNKDNRGRREGTLFINNEEEDKAKKDFTDFLKTSLGEENNWPLLDETPNNYIAQAFYSFLKKWEENDVIKRGKKGKYGINFEACFRFIKKCEVKTENVPRSISSWFRLCYENRSLENPEVDKKVEEFLKNKELE